MLAEKMFWPDVTTLFVFVIYGFANNFINYILTLVYLHKQMTIQSFIKYICKSPLLTPIFASAPLSDVQQNSLVDRMIKTVICDNMICVDQPISKLNPKKFSVHCEPCIIW